MFGQQLFNLLPLIGHQSVWQRQKKTKKNRHSNKDADDESASAHLPAGAPTGCVSSSPAVEPVGGEGGTKGGPGGKGGQGGPLNPLFERIQSVSMQVMDN